VFPEAPTGIGLAKALKQDGPLVTSISVDIGTDKISTTVKMDLYTSSFGKMQKQKEGNIAQISRERQKIIDQNNSAIRRGLGKSSTNANLFGGVLANGGSDIIAKARGAEEHFSDIEKGEAKRASYIAASKTAHDLGVPIGGTSSLISVAVEGGLSTLGDIIENASVSVDGTSTAEFDGNNWTQRLIGGAGAVLEFFNHDPNSDDDLPSESAPKENRN
jgi:hypothetical protein